MAGVGVLCVVAGAVFTLQGLGVIGGSFMSGSVLWAALGPLIVIVGLVLIARGSRR